MRVNIGEKLEKRFRELAMKKFGYGKGALSKAAQEAILRWVSQMETQEELMFEGDPVEAIDGLLADIDVESVDLQHKAMDLWRLKVLRNAPNRH